MKNANELIYEAENELKEMRPFIRKMDKLGVKISVEQELKDSHIVVTYPESKKSIKFFGNIKDSIFNKKVNPTLYVHIPFCDGICNYCGFKRMAVGKNAYAIDRYISYLEKEAVMIRSLIGRSQPSSIYIGGGTPTVLEPVNLEKIFRLIADNFGLEACKEFTLEASPNTLSIEKLKLAKSYGVNRISIGVQVFDDHILQNMARRHSVNDVENAIRTVREQCIENIDIDLMIAYPGTSQETMIKNLAWVKKLDIPSVTIYQYIKKSKSNMSQKNFNFNAEDALTQQILFRNGMEILGYDEFIVDWFSKAVNFRHEQNFRKWSEDSTQIAIGMGTYGYISPYQYFNLYGEPYFDAIDNGLIPVMSFATDRKDPLLRQLIFGLRTGVKLPFDLLGEETQKKLSDLIGAGALELSDGMIKLTRNGRLFITPIQEYFAKNNG